MTGRRRHHSGGPSSHSSHSTTTRPPDTDRQHHSGGGGGVGVDVDAIDTMAGRLDATRGRVHSVAGTVRGVNVGPQSMGVVGSGFTGAAQAHLRQAEAQVNRTTHAVEQAQRGTRGTADAYRTTDTTSAAALATIDTTTRPPTPTGGTPPPPPPPPPPGGGPPRNTLGHTAGVDELAPQYPQHVIDTAPTSTEQQIRDIAAAKGYDPDAHLPKTQTPTATLSHDDRVEVADVRNGFQVRDGEVLTKVVKPEYADAMLRNQTTFTDPDTGNTRDIRVDELGGSVARGSDTAQYDRPAQFREKLGLDDGGAGWSPIKAGSTEAYQLRFVAPDNMSRLDPSFGSTNPVDAADMQAVSGSAKLRPWDPPFLGTGYTDGGGTGSGLPEWDLVPGKHDDRIEMWEIRADGTEVLVGVNLPSRGWFDLR